MNPAPTTRISLIARLGGPSRDEDAWGEFVRVYSPHVLDWCRRYGLGRADALDVSQDVMLRFWRQAASFEYDPARTLRGYLRRMVTSAVSDWAHQARRCGRVSEQPLEETLAGEPAREDLAARIERAYDTELLAIAMREVQGRVERHTWEAFRLLAIEGLGGAETAARLGMQINTTYVARRRVQRMIREAIGRLDKAEVADAIAAAVLAAGAVAP